MRVRSGAVCLLIAFACSVQAQTTGTPPFGSFSGGPFDTINNANLNVQLEVPIFSRAGRGISFSYALTYDSTVWAPVSSTGAAAWTPSFSWGWAAQTQPALGYIRYATHTVKCDDGTYFTTWGSFWYIDTVGTGHFIPGAAVGNGPTDDLSCPTFAANATYVSNDGSGYTLKITTSQGDPTLFTSLTNRSGNSIAAPQLGPGSGGVCDANGNEITVSSGATATFSDSLSTTAALTVSGSGTATSPYQFAYSNPTGGTSSYKMNFTNYAVQTNFGCSGIAEYSSPSQPLVTSISLPDGTSYSFTYESTPGNSGSKTGRLQSVILPTGGTYTYTYSGGNNGINCSDGTAAGITRVTPDGTWTYATMPPLPSRARVRP